MNQTFSISRFGRLLRTYLTEHRGQLITNLALLTGGLIMVDLLFYHGYPQSVDANRNIPFYVIGWAAWYVFTWQLTDDLNQKERAITYLMRPASQVEKIVMLWLVSGVFFLVVYGVVFSVVDTLAVSIINNRNWSPNERQAIGSFQLLPFFQSVGFRDAPKLFWVYSALLHPFALTFLLVFRRYSLPLTGVLAFVLIGLGFLLNYSMLRALTDGGITRIQSPFDGFYAYSATLDTPGAQMRRVDLPQPIGNQLHYVLLITAVLLLYITAYFRFNEREV